MTLGEVGQERRALDRGSIVRMPGGLVTPYHLNDSLFTHASLSALRLPALNAVTNRAITARSGGLQPGLAGVAKLLAGTVRSTSAIASRRFTSG